MTSSNSSNIIRPFGFSTKTIFGIMTKTDIKRQWPLGWPKKALTLSVCSTWCGRSSSMFCQVFNVLIATSTASENACPHGAADGGKLLSCRRRRVLSWASIRLLLFLWRRQMQRRLRELSGEGKWAILSDQWQIDCRPHGLLENHAARHHKHNTFTFKSLFW